MKVAIVGRRNTGKSTLVNTLAQAERVIVSEVPGTTRDSIDVRYEMDGKTFVAIDTPGFRRGKSMATDIDFYSSHRGQRAIRRADVVLLFFDASQRISKVDKQLCDYIAQQYKPCVFVVNKWDLMAGKMPMEKWVAYLRDTFRTMLYVPIAFITGQTGQERQGDAQPRADALQAVADAADDVAAQQALAGGDRKEPSAHAAEPPGADLLCHAGGRAAADDRPVLQRAAADFARRTSATCWASFATSSSSTKCRSSSTSAAASSRTSGTRLTRRWGDERAARKSSTSGRKISLSTASAVASPSASPCLWPSRRRSAAWRVRRKVGQRR